MQEVLTIQLVDKNENIVNTNSQNEEGDDLRDDQSDLHAEQREQTDRRGYGKDDKSDPEKTKCKLGSNEEAARESREDSGGQPRIEGECR